MPETVATWWDDYARSMRRRNMSEGTARLYHRAYLRFWAWALSRDVDADLAAVSTADVNGWVDQLRCEASPQTVAVYWRTLRPLFS